MKPDFYWDFSKMENVHIYRFYDRVAVSPQIGGTFYVNAPKAARIARAINAVVREIKLKSFAESTVGTVAIKMDV